MIRLSASPAVGLALALLLAGCASTRQIRTQPPRPADVLDPDSAAAAPRMRFRVMLEAGDAPLPAGVRTLRFRVSEIWLRAGDEAWQKWRTDASELRLPAQNRAGRTLFSAEVPRRTYDQAALVFSDVYVEYGPNAGGPLTVPGETPLQIRIPPPPGELGVVDLLLRFEPGASVSQDAGCRWHFLPFVLPSVSPGS